MSDDSPTKTAPGTLRLTAFPPGDGPYVRWEMMVEQTGEIIGQGEFPLDNNAVREVVRRYRER